MFLLNIVNLLVNKFIFLPEDVLLCFIIEFKSTKDLVNILTFFQIIEVLQSQSVFNNVFNKAPAKCCKNFSKFGPLHVSPPRAHFTAILFFSSTQIPVKGELFVFTLIKK